MAPIRRALLSVYDKTGIVELAQALSSAGVQLISTGSTAATIRAAGITVREVGEVTGFAECLDGRVKTLHPAIHAGILADRRRGDHRDQLGELGIEPIDLVVVNLYPFTQTVASGAGFDDCVEQIDIGGPAMVRAAAKNHASVAVVVDPGRYGEVRRAVAGDGFTDTERRELARDAYRHTAEYDLAVATWFGTQTSANDDAAELPEWHGRIWQRTAQMRYGENPHQRAALYIQPGTDGLAQAEQLHGKHMSYNNYVDADAAWRAAHDFADPAVAIIKHANPCGIAVGADVAQAHRKAHACDPLSAYGAVIAVNQPVSVEMAKQVAPIFTEVLVAPDFEPGALEILQAKKNLRILRSAAPAGAAFDLRPITGGALLQDRDLIDAPGDAVASWLEAGPATGAPADPATLADLEFAWRAVRSVKSNAILLAKDGASVGVGMGQVNRVDSCHLAVQRAGAERAHGSVAASDAFFPFADGLQVLIDAGVRAVIQPGGSIRDGEVIEAANAAGITMYLTGTRHFFH